jgi:hypothetical protein
LKEEMSLKFIVRSRETVTELVGVELKMGHLYLSKVEGKMAEGWISFGPK